MGAIAFSPLQPGIDFSKNKWRKCSIGLKFPTLFPLRVLLVESTVGIEIEIGIAIENQFNTEALDTDFDFDSKNTNSRATPTENRSIFGKTKCGYSVLGN